MRKRLIVTTVVTTALMLLPAAASASTDTFGSHVSQHAQQHGFTGDHNPGVLHQGASGWIPCDHAPTS